MIFRLSNNNDKQDGLRTDKEGIINFVFVCLYAIIEVVYGLMSCRLFCRKEQKKLQLEVLFHAFIHVNILRTIVHYIDESIQCYSDRINSILLSYGYTANLLIFFIVLLFQPCRLKMNPHLIISLRSLYCILR